MDAQSARERRQARIRAGAADRLAKITGSNASKPTSLQTPEPASTDSARSPSESRSSAPLDNSSLASQFDDPPVSTPSFASQANISPEFANDPLFQMLSRATSQAGMAGPGLGAGGPGGPGPQQANDLLELLKQAAHGSGQEPGPSGGSIFDFASGDSPAPKATADTLAKKVTDTRWELIHLLVTLVVACYSAWKPFRLVQAFLLTQVLLVSLRLFFDPYTQQPFLMTILSYVPAQFRSRAKMVSRGYVILREMYRDFMLVVFIYGLGQVLPWTEVYARPVQ